MALPAAVCALTILLSDIIADPTTRHIVEGIGVAVGIVGLFFGAPLVREGLRQRFQNDPPPSIRS